MAEQPEPDKYLFKYIKINSKNNLNFVIDESDESEFENLELKSTVATFEEEIIGKQLLKFTNKFLPKEKDYIKMNNEQNKIFNKQFQSEKNELHSTILRILSTDYKDIFVFNYTNINDICRILSKSFNEIRKLKIETGEIFLSLVKNIKFEKYNFMECLNQQKLDNLKCTVSATADKIDQRENNENKGIYHIDTKKFYNSSKIKNNNCNFLTQDCFNYPKDNSDTKELPIELILLLSKLKDVKTLVFQIKNIDEQLLKKNIFVLLNIEWLFPSLSEISLDLDNDELQKDLNEVFELRARDLYTKYAQNKNLYYYSNDYHARTINLWDPESDIYFDDFIENLNTNYKLNDPPTEENSSTYDNLICNIFNEFDHKTNLKYIAPIKFNKNYDINYQNVQQSDDIDENDNLNDSIDNKDNNPNFNKRVSIMPSNSMHTNLPNFNNMELNQKYEELKKAKQLTTPKIVTEYVKDKISSFEMILLFGWFLKKLKNLEKLSLYFQDSFSYELELMLNYFDICYNNFHFLLLNNKLNNLREVDFSFNSLDNKSFESILGIINKNKKIFSLKISFFTPDKNFQQSGLFKLCSSMNISIRNIFRELKTDLSKNNNCKNKDIDYFILNHKLLNYFESNMRKLFILLRQKPALKEIIFRLDLPSLILSSEKYLLTLIKFILNLLCFISFEKNLIKELKILSPELILDCNKYPFIKEFFNELLPDEEIDSFKQKISNHENKEEEEFTEKLTEIKQEDLKKNLEENNTDKTQMIGRNSTKKLIINQENPILKGFSLSEKEEKNVMHSKDDNYFRSSNSKKMLINNEEKDNIEEKKIIESNKEKQLNDNYVLKNITLQLKIFNLPEIFNICLVNNITGLQKINISELDEISFLGFEESYKKNYEIMQNLISLKIGIGNSVISYSTKLENAILDFIKLNTPKLEEKLLFTHLEITNEDKFHKLIHYVYFRTNINKLVCQISGKKEVLKKVINSYIDNSKKEMGSLIILMNLDEYKKLKNNKILECLTSFYSKRKNRAIIWKDNNMFKSFDYIIDE